MTATRALALVLVLIVAACTGTAPPPSPSPTPTQASPDPRPSVAATADPLCTHGPTPPPASSSPPSPSAEIATLAGQVEVVRGLEFMQEVSPEPVTREEIGRLVLGSIDTQFPREMMDRRGQAWATMGAIPEGTDLFGAITDFGSTQIVGFYDTITQRLVFVSADPPSPLHRFTLAHELTHALDDQHFDLGAVDELVLTCQDERTEALLALAEGDAVEMSLRWARANLSAAELVRLGIEVGTNPAPPTTVPQFVRDMFASPYLSGQSFVQTLLDTGGQEALDAAFRDPPRSMEQVLHPEKYGVDEPQIVEAPDVEESLGQGWDDLDFQDVGEAWLIRLLDVELPSSDARNAAAGWDGGQYRAWNSGSASAVILETVWDSEEEAAEFADAVETWAQDRPIEASPEGTSVTVLFANDDETLDLLRTAAG
jgi:hypothetical protein